MASVSATTTPFLKVTESAIVTPSSTASSAAPGAVSDEASRSRGQSGANGKAEAVPSKHGGESDSADEDEGQRDTSQSLVLLSGLLTKRGRIIKSWKPRKFVLLSERAASGEAVMVLEYYEPRAGGALKLKGRVPLDGYVVEDALEVSRKFPFKLVKQGCRSYFFSAPTANVRRQWMRELKQALQGIEDWSSRMTMGPAATAEAAEMLSPEADHRASYYIDAPPNMSEWLAKGGDAPATGGVATGGVATGDVATGDVATGGAATASANGANTTGPSTATGTAAAGAPGTEGVAVGSQPASKAVLAVAASSNATKRTSLHDWLADNAVADAAAAASTPDAERANEGTEVVLEVVDEDGGDLSPRATDGAKTDGDPLLDPQAAQM